MNPDWNTETICERTGTEWQYRKISIISPGRIFVQKAFLLGLFSGELIFGGAYYWKEFCVSTRIRLDNENSYDVALTVHGLYSGGLIIERICASQIWGAYFREGLFFGELVLATCFACFLFSGEGHYFLNSNLGRATIFETVNRGRATISEPKFFST